MPPAGAEARQPHWVMKRGAKSDVTLGVTGEIEAVFRVPRDPLLSIVLDFAGDLDVQPDKLAFFSAQGDSGSAVFAEHGQIVGVLAGGVGSKRAELPQSLAARIPSQQHCSHLGYGAGKRAD